MERRTFLLSAATILTAISSRSYAESPDLTLVGIELIVIDVQCNSRRPELVAMVPLPQMASRAVSDMQEEFRSARSKTMVVTRADLPPVDAQFPPLSELYVTVRIDLDYASPQPSSVVGAVGLLLRRVEYGSKLFSDPWSFFQSEPEQATLDAAINEAVKNEVISLAKVLTQSTQ